jgi:hypothetical protein
MMLRPSTRELIVPASLAVFRGIGSGGGTGKIKDKTIDADPDPTFDKN